MQNIGSSSCRHRNKDRHNRSCFMYMPILILLLPFVLVSSGCNPQLSPNRSSDSSMNFSEEGPFSVREFSINTANPSPGEALALVKKFADAHKRVDSKMVAELFDYSACQALALQGLPLSDGEFQTFQAKINSHSFDSNPEPESLEICAVTIPMSFKDNLSKKAEGVELYRVDEGTDTGSVYWFRLYQGADLPPCNYAVRFSKNETGELRIADITAMKSGLTMSDRLRIDSLANMPPTESRLSALESEEDKLLVQHGEDVKEVFSLMKDSPESAVRKYQQLPRELQESRLLGHFNIKYQYAAQALFLPEQFDSVYENAADKRKDDLHVNLMMMLMLGGKGGNAQRGIVHRIYNQTQDPLWLCYLAKLELRDGQFDRARQTCRQAATECEQRFLEPYMVMYAIEKSDGNKDEAQQFLDAAQKLADNNREFFILKQKYDELVK